MGLFTRVPKVTDLSAASTVAFPLTPASDYTRGIVGPNTPSHTLTHVLADILGQVDYLPVTREEAMQIPAVAKARALLCGTIAGLPLKAMKDGTPLATQPTWLYRSDTSVSPQHRLNWIVDDLLFYGTSLLYVARGQAGQIVDAFRVPVERWEIDQDGVVKIDNNAVSKDEAILIDGLDGGGLLHYAGRSIRAARDLENTRASRLRNPAPTIEIHLTEDAELEQEEIDDLIAAWNKARNSSNGSVTFTPHNVEIREHGATPVDLFIEAQNQVAVNIAQHTNIPATLLDASVAAGASLNYQNMAESRSWWIDTSLSYWLLPITSRLSMDDVTPRGTYLAFDLSSLVTLPQPTSSTPVLED